ncbi:putative Transcriptional Coactivator p15 (PC4) [Monocercomonoides exilis]|uniref:putative Transcriptional Coactivator p15 (PC4) n=1 Tax=Monocercomonoides exilis TaxID=2049356 RepID=UPI00355AA2E6|nr:putative Transcriptional Coactivator p15 (PC4) [Monocercomonoides exilis]|eukprot:MONOS_13159.1-p1 / transcript=MONOS_13159.1 / gene=MONOS_13159 / organism=Monocercomonoides_exilis_PA203 / gene_product=unspecified product / transcript_product=unspecified product / location=Mono_scaffold00784:8154-8669(-) / protein_length=118 / sequence_SO=supercontig / SO=protein_coding / is_pseudo=false
MSSSPTSPSNNDSNEFENPLQPEKRKRMKAAEDIEPDPEEPEVPPKRKEPDVWELGNQKRISISEFKGKYYVDIREFYTDPAGDLKPGRKGISLKPEQWDLLLSYATEVNQALKKKQR